MEQPKRSRHPWKGIPICLTSKHGKFDAIQKPFQRILGLEVVADSSTDTDLLGTFSGEVERPGPPREVVVKKAQLGAQNVGARLGLATEGSFAPHPQMPWIPSHLELMACVDMESGTSIVESLQTEETNFAHFKAESFRDLDSFLTRARFPSHALILRPAHSGQASSNLYKGITDPAALEEAFHHCQKIDPHGQVHIETDMRAHLNPTRLKVIEALAEKLATRLLNLCPKCRYPGFGTLRYERGLECEACEAPSAWVKSVIQGCAACGHEIQTPREDGRQHAPQSACERCETADE
jgi:hypothetical protein